MGYRYLTKFYPGRLRPEVQPLQPWAIGDPGGYLTKFCTGRLRPEVQPLQPWAIGDPGGYLTKFLMGRLHPEVQLLTPLCTSFCRKGTPFVYLPLTMVPLSHSYFRTLHPFSPLLMHCLYELSSNHTFSRPFLSHKMYLLVLDRFPYPFICLKPVKGTPFGRSLPVKAIVGSTPGGHDQPLPFPSLIHRPTQDARC